MSLRVVIEEVLSGIMSYLLSTHGSDHCRRLKSTPLVERAEVNCTWVLCIMVNSMESLYKVALLSRKDILHIVLRIHINKRKAMFC